MGFREAETRSSVIIFVPHTKHWRYRTMRLRVGRRVVVTTIGVWQQT